MNLAANSDYVQYINDVAFRFMKPENYVKGFKVIDRWFRKVNFSLEVLNTRLPGGSRQIHQSLLELQEIPKMSTFAIGAIINQGIFRMEEDCSFVNIGVWHGYTLLSAMKNNPNKKCVGVDNFSEFGGPQKAFLKRFNTLRSSMHHFYELDYREYFLNIHNTKIGYYIYDGDHSYQHQLNGLQIAEPYFEDNCIILIDDTNTTEARNATSDFIANSSSSYEIILDKKTLFNEHPTFWNGIMILQKIG